MSGGLVGLSWICGTSNSNINLCETFVRSLCPREVRFRVTTIKKYNINAKNKIRPITFQNFLKRKFNRVCCYSESGHPQSNLLEDPEGALKSSHFLKLQERCAF